MISKSLQFLFKQVENETIFGNSFRSLIDLIPDKFASNKEQYEEMDKDWQFEGSYYNGESTPLITFSCDRDKVVIDFSCFIGVIWEEAEEEDAKADTKQMLEEVKSMQKIAKKWDDLCRDFIIDGFTPFDFEKVECDCGVDDTADEGVVAYATVRLYLTL